MSWLLGKEVRVCLDYDEMSICGTLLDIDSGTMYLDNGAKICAIPYKRVLYYSVDVEKPPASFAHESTPKPNASTHIDIIVDDNHITSLPGKVASGSSNELYLAVISNSLVASALSGKKVKQAYLINDKFYITTDQNDQDQGDEFSMELAGDVTGSFLSGAQMAARIKPTRKGGAQDE